MLEVSVVMTLLKTHDELHQINGWVMGLSLLSYIVIL